MTLVNRKTVRAALVSAISTDITAFQSVLGYLPKDLQGQSPVCTVESGPIKYNTQMDDGLPQKFQFVIGHWVRRDGASGSGITAATAEDLIDDLALALANFIRSKYNGSFLDDSILDYEEQDGPQYRVEFHLVEIEY